MSRTHQRIAEFFTQNPNDVAVHNLSTLARICDVHASSFVRFAQTMGYKGFKELQTHFQERLSTAAPGFEARRKALSGELEPGAKQVNHILDNLVMRDIASLEALAHDIDPGAIEAASTFLHKAQTVYLLGQLRSEPVAVLLRYILTMLGKPCVLLDASGGLATHMARTMTPQDALIAVSFRFYATEVVNIVEQAQQSDIPVIAITDSTLSPYKNHANVLFAIPEHEYTFARSLAAPMCLAQALMVHLAGKLQNNANDPRIPTVTSTPGKK